MGSLGKTTRVTLAYGKTGLEVELPGRPHYGHRAEVSARAG